MRPSPPLLEEAAAAAVDPGLAILRRPPCAALGRLARTAPRRAARACVCGLAGPHPLRFYVFTPFCFTLPPAPQASCKPPPHANCCPPRALKTAVVLSTGTGDGSLLQMSPGTNATKSGPTAYDASARRRRWVFASVCSGEVFLCVFQLFFCPVECALNAPCQLLSQFGRPPRRRAVTTPLEAVYDPQRLIIPLTKIRLLLPPSATASLPCPGAAGEPPKPPAFPEGGGHDARGAALAARLLAIAVYAFVALCAS
jgi:hypothetical protein